MDVRACRLVGVRVAAHQVFDAGLVSVLESFTIGFAFVMRNRRMAEFIAILNVGLTVILVVLARSFNAVVEALRLRSLNLGWGSSPYFMAIIRRRRWVLRVLPLRRNAHQCCCCDCC